MHIRSMSVVRSVVQVLSAYVCVFVMVGCGATIDPPKFPDATREVSVMSFNIRWDNPEDGDNGWPMRRSACAKLLDEHSPDIVGFQETQLHMLHELVEDMPEYDWVGVGRDDGVEAGEFAPIFYKTDVFEIAEWGTFWLSETPERVSVGWDAALERIVTWAELKRVDDGSSVFVFNTHFDHEGGEARKESASLLADRVVEIAGLEVATFVTGDFNAQRGDGIFDPLLELLYDARHAPETDDESTFNAFGSWVTVFVGTIDFVFYRQAEVLRFDTIQDDYGVPWVSDHYPIIADFKY